MRRGPHHHPSAILPALGAGLLAFLASLPLSANPVRVQGSDLVEEAFGKVIAGAPPLEGEDLEFAFPGSSLAMARLRDGSADLVIAAFPPDQTPPGDLYFAQPLAFQVAVVVVHPENPLQEISLDQLRRVMASGGSGAIQWGAVGLSGAWASRPVNAVVHDRRDHLAAEILRVHALGGATVRPGVLLAGPVDPILARLGNDTGVLAVLPVAPPAGRGKILAVSADASGYAYGPTVENVFFGDYPLRLVFHVVIRAEDRERLKPLLRWLQDDAVAAALESSGFMAIPAATRRQRMLEMDLARPQG